MRVQTTMAMNGGGTGYVIPLQDVNGNPTTCRFLQITSAQTECYVQGVFVAPGAALPAVPTAAVIPAAAAGPTVHQSPFTHLGYTNGPQQVTLTWDRGNTNQPAGETSDVYSHVLCWNNGGAAGDLALIGN